MGKVSPYEYGLDTYIEERAKSTVKPPTRDLLLAVHE